MRLFSLLLKRMLQHSDESNKEELTEARINGMECIAVGQVSRCSCKRTGTGIGIENWKIRFVHIFIFIMRSKNVCNDANFANDDALKIFQ